MKSKDLRISRICKALMPLINNNEKVLDMGCGNTDTGNYLLSQMDINYTGVDILDLGGGNKNPRINFVKSSIPYPFQDKSFDTVVIIFVLHHLNDPESGLKEAVRLARKKILLLEDVPRNWFERKGMELVDFFGNRMVSKDIPIPFNFYEDSKWKRIFKEQQLNLKSRSVVYPLPFPRLNHYLYELRV